MNGDGIAFTILKAMPVLKPSDLAARSQSLQAYIGHGDTVSIKPTYGCNGFIGRILSVSGTIKNKATKTSVHPFSWSEKCRSCPGLLIQLFITRNNQHGKSSWGGQSVEKKQACSNLDEAAETNKVVWVPVDLVQDLVHIIHEDDAVNQTYGPVAGRANTFFLRKKAIFATSGKPNLFEKPLEKYNMFGSNCGDNRLVTYTERMLFGTSVECQKNLQMLSKRGKLDTGSARVNYPMGFEYFAFLRRRLSELPRKVVKRELVRHILHPNLSIESKLYDAAVEVIEAKDDLAFDACQKAFSSTQGAGVKKRFPTKSIMSCGNKRFRLSERDTINIVYVDPCSHFEELQFDGKVDPARFKSHNNYIRWSFNPITQFCLTSVRCIPIVAGCNSEAVASFLESRNIYWASGEDDDIMDCEFMDECGDFWTVVNVDEDDGSAIISGHDNSRWKRVTIQYCLGRMD